MSKLLLIHNSDTYFPDGIEPLSANRPNFFWYTDRFVSHLGTSKYLYIFVINPKDEGIELRCRAKPFDFDALHKGFLHFKEYHEGKHPQYKFNIESGIAMSFSKLTPIVALRAVGDEDETLKLDFEIIKPTKLFDKKTVVRLFKEPYSKLYTDKPIPFSQIPEIAKLIPDIDDLLPFKHIDTNEVGIFEYNDWLPMRSHSNGTWI